MADPMITRTTFAGRGVVRQWDPSANEDVASWPDVAADAIRAVNHLTGNGHPIPAPVAYEVLGNLAALAHRLPQALTPLAQGLNRSMDEFTVTDSAGDPRTSATTAVEALTLAAQLAEQVGAALAEAQQAIAGQGYDSDAPAAAEHEGS